jgi:hypothetical protein
MDRNHLSVKTAFLVPLCSGAPTFANIPVGYEIADITSGPIFHHAPRMNDCGEVVFYVGYPADTNAEIFYYDNGLLTQVTDNNEADSYPDINDIGTIVWTQGPFVDGVGTNLMTRNGRTEIIGFGWGMSINNLDHAVWDTTVPDPTCAYESNVFLYDGMNIIQITSDNRSNRNAKINDHNEIVWTSYDFSLCAFPNWTSVIMFYSNGVIMELPSSLENPQLPAINNLGHAAWADFDYVEVWNGEETTVFTEGSMPSLNDKEDVVFARWHPYWRIWVYLDGEFHDINDTTPPFQGLRPDINNDGEAVWSWCHNPDLIPAGIRLLRRVRNGDVDRDFDADLTDFAASTEPWVEHPSFPDCLTGPGDFDRLCRCRFYDMQHDRDVDLGDFAQFQNAFGHLYYDHACCLSHDSPGCGQPVVEACVCAVLPDCCETAWDASCAILLNLLGCGTCE